MVCDRGDHVRQIYFPLTCVLSLVAVLTDGTTVEAASVGYEGAFGLFAALSGGEAALRCLVQIGGNALCVDAGQLKMEFSRNELVQDIMLRYMATLLFQTQQSVACSVRHSVQQRLCRWLLTMHDRVRGDALPLTHEFIADTMGVNRTSVTLAAAALQDAGLIRYRRGVVSIIDRRLLEKVCCECYVAVRDHYERRMSSRKP